MSIRRLNSAEKSVCDLTVLYIAGYGRSGSTVLDVLLGAHEQVVSTGELVYLGKEWSGHDRVCACGSDYQQCSFWKDVFATYEEAKELTQLTQRVESRSRLFHLLSDAISTQDRRAYRRRIRSLFSCIARKTGAKVVVDSSKSARDAAGRFWALQNVAGIDVRVVHLTRDGRSVLRSVVEKGTNWAAEGYRKEKRLLAARTTIGWTLANGLTWALGTALDGDRYRRVRFEDLLENPEPVLRRVGKFAGLDLSSVIHRISSGQSFPVGHNVGGNRVRHQDTIQLRQRNGKSKNPWKELDLHHKALFGVLGQCMNVVLGYE